MTITQCTTGCYWTTGGRLWIVLEDGKAVRDGLHDLRNGKVAERRLLRQLRSEAGSRPRNPVPGAVARVSNRRWRWADTKTSFQRTRPRFRMSLPRVRRPARDRAQGPQPRVRRLRAGRRGDPRRRTGRAMCCTGPGNPPTPGRARATDRGFPARPFTSMHRKRPVSATRTSPPRPARAARSAAASRASAGTGSRPLLAGSRLPTV